MIVRQQVILDDQIPRRWLNVRWKPLWQSLIGNEGIPQNVSDAFRFDALNRRAKLVWPVPSVDEDAEACCILCSGNKIVDRIVGIDEDWFALGGVRDEEG